MCVVGGAGSDYVAGVERDDSLTGPGERDRGEAECEIGPHDAVLARRSWDPKQGPGRSSHVVGAGAERRLMLRKMALSTRRQSLERPAGRVVRPENPSHRARREWPDVPPPKCPAKQLRLRVRRIEEHRVGPGLDAERAAELLVEARQTRADASAQLRAGIDHPRFRTEPRLRHERVDRKSVV